MKIKYAVALTGAAFALGALTVQALHAQAKPPVYFVAEITVTNPDAYGKEYSPKAQASIKAHGGKLLALGGSGGGGAEGLKVFEGEAPKRAAIQVWDSMEKLQAWYNSPEYKEARSIGTKYATFRTYAIEGR